jgi:hypothetical protein
VRDDTSDEDPGRGGQRSGARCHQCVQQRHFKPRIPRRPNIGGSNLLVTDFR